MYPSHMQVKHEQQVRGQFAGIPKQNGGGVQSGVAKGWPRNGGDGDHKANMGAKKFGSNLQQPIGPSQNSSVFDHRDSALSSNMRSNQRALGKQQNLQ